MMDDEGKASKVLVIEDDLDILLTVRGALEQEGYHIRSAVNGHGAILNIEDDPPDVILLDLCLPEMDGKQLCETLRRDFGSLPPIVMVSASPSLKQTADALGLRYYLPKPFDLEDLLQMLESARQAGPTT